jgi:hypothetical protein
VPVHVDSFQGYLPYQLTDACHDSI